MLNNHVKAIGNNVLDIAAFVDANDNQIRLFKEQVQLLEDLMLRVKLNAIILRK